jgi:hypothetical protein
MVKSLGPLMSRIETHGLCWGNKRIGADQKLWLINECDYTFRWLVIGELIQDRCVKHCSASSNKIEKHTRMRDRNPRRTQSDTLHAPGEDKYKPDVAEVNLDGTDLES